MNNNFCSGLASTPLRPPPGRRWRGCSTEKHASASAWQPAVTGSAKAQNVTKSNPVSARICRSSVIVFTSSIPKNTIWEQLYSLINSAVFRPLVENAATGSTRKRIGLDLLKRLPLLVPPLEEQQKIADTLSSLDNRITAQTQKIKALKLYKKGLMQNLFPAAAEPTT